MQFIRLGSMVGFAAQANAVISLHHRPGHFIVQGHTIGTVWPPEAAAQVNEALARAHITGPYRTLTQDVSFGIDQLVEIAIRALSPAVNDTFTAITCVDWLGDSLCTIARRWHPARVHRDDAGVHPGDRGPAELRAPGAAVVREDPAGQHGHARHDDPPARRLSPRS